MTHVRPMHRPTVRTATLVCEVHQDLTLPDGQTIRAGARVVIENLGEEDGAVLYRVLDTATARAILTHPSVSVVPVARRAGDRRGVWRPVPVLRLES